MPAVVDLAAMRDAITRLGGNPDKINPLVSWKDDPAHITLQSAVL